MTQPKSERTSGGLGLIYLLCLLLLLHLHEKNNFRNDFQLGKSSMVPWNLILHFRLFKIVQLLRSSRNSL